MQVGKLFYIGKIKGQKRMKRGQEKPTQNIVYLVLKKPLKRLRGLFLCEILLIKIHNCYDFPQF